MAEGLARTYAGIREKGTEIRKKMANAGGFLKYAPMLMIIIAAISGVFRIKEGTFFDADTTTAARTQYQQNAPSTSQQRPQQEARREAVRPPIVCTHQERLLVDSRSWRQALETPGCEFHISRGRGPVLEMRINKDDTTIRDFPETGAPKYNSPAWVMEFRLKGSSTQPVAITVQHVRP